MLLYSEHFSDFITYRLFIQLELNLAMLSDVSISPFFIQILNFLITVC